MAKRKDWEDHWDRDELAVPLPIQIYLWRQCSPFVRPKLGKLHEATCSICQTGPSHHEVKEASKSLEKVLVQNILYGLSPSLTDAIRSVPRWRFVQASFPHVMHCASTLLYNRRDSTTDLGPAETKLLYTLHWILLDAAEECADADAEKGCQRSSPYYYLFSVTSIQVFIYMFAPLLNTLKESDFQNFRLENGLKIWTALWEYRHPDVPVFTSPVRPRRALLRGKRIKRSTTKFGDVFLGVGKGNSGSSPYQGLSPEDDSVFYMGSGSGSSGGGGGGRAYVHTYSDGSTSITDCMEVARIEEELRMAAGPRDSFPETIPEETSSAEEEHVVIFRLGSYTENDGFKESQVYKAEHPSSFLRPPMVEVSDITGNNQPIYQGRTGSLSTSDSQSPRPTGSISPYKSSSHFSSSLGSEGRVSPLADPTLATIFDVAVLRCLFVNQWTEEGVYWALTFIYKRLQEIGHEVSQKEAPRRRSNSLPVPKIQVSFHADPPDGKSKDQDGSEHSSSEHNYVSDTSMLIEAPRRERDSGGSTRKKKKISDLKAFVETKLWSRSEKALEKIGRDDSRRSSVSDEKRSETGASPWAVERPQSAMDKAPEVVQHHAPLSPSPSMQGLVKGKSMPSLRFVGDNHDGNVAKAETTDSGAEESSTPGQTAVKRPIITVTQHTPSPSEQCRDHISQSGSLEAHVSPTQHGRCSGYPESSKSSPKPPLSRSQTDSNIQYPCHEESEIPGTIHFVTKEGYINLKILLKAAQSIANRDILTCSIRVCENLLRLLDFLLDMGMLKMSIKISKNEKGKNETKEDEKKTEIEEDSKQDRPVDSYMDAIIRIICHLGCPHGCNEGLRGPPADFLRHSAHAVLSRIYRCDQIGFRNYMRYFVQVSSLREILEFFHAFVGFCVDPSSLLSPMSEWIARLQDTKRPGTGRIIEGQQGGYATNFGSSLGGAGTRGIEGQLVASCFKALVTRCVNNHTLLKSPDSMAMYSDVRQLMCYIKESHGGIFRRVALSGLIDSSDRPHRKVTTTQTRRVVRRVPLEVARESPTGPSETLEGVKSKKSLFKKKVTSTSITSVMRRGPSMSSVYDDQQEESSRGQSPVATRRRHHPMFHSRQGENEHLLHGNIRKKRMRKLVNWLRKTTTGAEDMSGLGSLFANDSSEIPPTLARKFSQGGYSRPRLVSRPGPGHMTHKLHLAKKKMEDKLGKITFGKKQKDTSSDDTPDLSRRNSEDFEGTPREATVILLRERKIIDCDIVKTGMMRFNFLMDTCQPGSVPDPQLAGAVLDLPGAPVISRACLLLEMCHFVHKCNTGAWPSWMKTSLPFYRSFGPNARAATAGTRRVPALQRVAGKMFYAWAESIAIRLEELFDELGPTADDINVPVQDNDVKRALRTKDEEEDFLDELNVNPGGGDCPMALRMIAVQLLLEITTFMRETFPLLPKSGRMSVPERAQGWSGHSSLGVARDHHSRRWSTTLPSMGHPHASAQSLHSFGEGQPIGDRKISFALHHDGDNDSMASSNTTLTSMQINEDDRRKFGQGSRGHILKKSSGSFKRRSYKFKRQQKDPDTDSIMRSDSTRSKRKVSAVSERSDNSDHLEHDISGEESPGVLSNEDLAESPGDPETSDEHLMGNFPWLRVVVRMGTAFNTQCTHQHFCHPRCYRRCMRACSRLIHAARKLYGETFEEEEKFSSQSKNGIHASKKDKKQPRKPSEQTHGSPKRKDSLVKKERVDKSVDISIVLSKLGHPQLGSAIHLSKDTLVTAGYDDNVSKEKDNKEKKNVDPHPIISYLKHKVMGLFYAPFSLVIKAMAVIPEELLIGILPTAWDMLLDHDNEFAAIAAVIFILSGVRTPGLATNIINSQLTHADPSIRLNAILRFQVLWKSRYQVWTRMEEGAQMTFKVPPHAIEFTLPSPKVGVESISVVDPPWMPQTKPNVEEFTLDQLQSKHRSLITANRTRRKIHAEMVKNALETEEAKRRKERENFLLSAVPCTTQAAYEPSMHHVATEEHEEGEDNEADTMGRQVAVHHMSSAQPLLPSCLCSAVLTIIHLLDDPAVTPDGVAVYQTAEQVIWSCLVENSALVLRFFLEKLTREKQDVMTRLLRRLIRFIPRLPSQAAFALFNYLVGYVMFYTRSPHEGAQEHTAAALSILWMIVPSVHGILFKDLKQIFRKEQCDAALLLTANIPSAKKIIVHGPGGLDAGGIPCQFPIQEDTQFSQIHSEAVDFFGIPEEDSKMYFLVDHKTNQIHNMHSYVRDFYFFKRSQYPQLLLVKMECADAFEALQMQAFMQKFLEIGKVLVAWSILKRPDQVAPRVFFLHEELTKLPSFPRKALESDFSLYKGGSMDKELRGLDQLHKYTWVQLIARMFEGLESTMTYTNDLRLFISVINGVLILHCEDSSMLRLCMATYINAANDFRNLFATNGYMLIMPTILRVYSNYQSNRMVCKVIEMVVKQLYILHRKPFVLQMLGSVAPLLDTDDAALYGDANKIRGNRLFDLLHSLERQHEDHLNILELVGAKKPLRAIDFCYHEESDNLSMLEVIDMCVTVVAYAADSRRGHQMLAILEAILARTLQLMQKTSKRDLRQEKETIFHVAVAIRTLVINCEPLAKNYNGPQLSGPGGTEGWASNRGPYTKASRSLNPGIEADDDSHSKYVSEAKRQPQNYTSDIEDPELLRQQFRQPRAMLLNIVAEFTVSCSARLAEISKKTAQDLKHIELLDTKCHLRLTEVAHSLLKMAPYDPATMGCTGLQRYMNDILPQPEWSHEDLKPALVNILRRMEKMFNKLFKKSTVRRITDWVAASNLLKGIYTTLCRHPYIANLLHLKQLVQVCQSLVLGERISESDSGYPSVISPWSNFPPQDFCSVVVRIIATQILALGTSHSLEQVCGGSSSMPSSEKTENLVINLLLPLCLRVGCASKDSPRMRQADISFAVTVVLHAMNPPLIKMNQTNPMPLPKSGQAPRSMQPTRSGQASDPRSQSWSHQHLEAKNIPKVKHSLLRIAFLGLKVMIICFEKQLSQDWHKIVHCLRNMDSRDEGGISMLDFLDFCLTYRTPLFLHIRPFILKKIRQHTNNETIKHYQQLLRTRLQTQMLPEPVCKGTLIRTLGHQLRTLKEDMSKIGESEIRPSTLEIQTEIGFRRRKASATESRIHSPPKKSKEAESSSHPKLFRKTSILRKRASSSSLLKLAGKVDENVTSAPTTPGEKQDNSATDDDGSQSGKHRLQRQMAQSRKTFRFQKSRYGRSETKSPEDSDGRTTPSGSSITKAPEDNVTSESITDSTIRKLQVPKIPEEDPSFRSTPSPCTEAVKTLEEKRPVKTIEPDPSSEISYMETSNISGYRESFPCESSMKDLEELELQIKSGFYPRSAIYRSRNERSDDILSGSSIDDTTGYPSPTESIRTSAKSSTSSRKLMFQEDLPREDLPWSRNREISEFQTQASIPDYRDIYNREVLETQKAPSHSYSFDQGYIHTQSRDAEAKKNYETEQEVPQPSYRHSWTPGIDAGSGRDRASKPIRKTGIVQPRVPRASHQPYGPYYEPPSAILSRTYETDVAGNIVLSKTTIGRPTDTTGSSSNKRFMVDKFTISFTEKDEEDTLI